MISLTALQCFLGATLIHHLLSSMVPRTRLPSKTAVIVGYFENVKKCAVVLNFDEDFGFSLGPGGVPSLGTRRGAVS